jgi:hypothetical protein
MNFSKKIQFVSKGCLFLFNYFIDMSPKLIIQFLSKKHVFEGKKHVFSTKNGPISMGLMSIKYLDKERQPLVQIQAIKITF